MKTIKNKIVVILLLLYMGANAQFTTPSIYRALHSNISFSYTADIRNAVVGSKPTNDDPALNYNVRANLRSAHIETFLFYEQFNKIKFQSFGVGVNYIDEVMNIEWLTLSGGFELLSINRESNGGVFAYGFNTELGVRLVKRLTIVFRTNLTRRTDLGEYDPEGKGKFVLSNHFGVKGTLIIF